MRVTIYDPVQHEAFVIGTWLSSYAKAPAVAKLPRDLYYAYQRALIRELIPRSVVLVAEDEGLLIGWVCAERVRPGLVVGHYIFAKSRDRGMGVGASLVSSMQTALGHDEANERVVVTHSRKPFSVWCDRMRWRYEPRYLSKRNHEEEAA